LQMEGRTRDLAMFNLAIDSKLRGCDIVALRVEDVAPSGYAVRGVSGQKSRDLLNCNAHLGLRLRQITPHRRLDPNSRQLRADLS
jgi:hypothetical protein